MWQNHTKKNTSVFALLGMICLHDRHIVNGNTTGLQSRTVSWHDGLSSLSTKFYQLGVKNYRGEITISKVAVN